MKVKQLVIAAALSRRTKDVGLVVLGNSIALYNPPLRVAEEFAKAVKASGGAIRQDVGARPHHGGHGP